MWKFVHVYSVGNIDNIEDNVLILIYFIYTAIKRDPYAKTRKTINRIISYIRNRNIRK